MKKLYDDIDNLTESIEYKTQLIGRNQRLLSGLNHSRLKGIAMGFVLTFILIGLPILYYKGGL